MESLSVFLLHRMKPAARRLSSWIIPRRRCCRRVQPYPLCFSRILKASRCGTMWNHVEPLLFKVILRQEACPAGFQSASETQTYNECPFVAIPGHRKSRDMSSSFVVEALLQEMPSAWDSNRLKHQCISSGTKWCNHVQPSLSNCRLFHVLVFAFFLNLQWIAEKVRGLANDSRGRFRMKLLGIAWRAMGMLYVFVLFGLQCWSHPDCTKGQRDVRWYQVSAASQRFQELLRTLRLMKGAGSLRELNEKLCPQEFQLWTVRKNTNTCDYSWPTPT